MRILMIVITFIVCYVPVFLIMGITPYITRRTESFGITIPENIYHDPQVKKIREGYRNNVLLFGGMVAAAVLLIAINANASVSAVVLPGGIFVEIILMFVFYAIGHNKMKLLKEKSNWTTSQSQKIMVDTEFRRKKVRVSPWWFIMHFAAIVITIGMGLYMYDFMPNRVPMNYDLSGQVTRWADKSYKLLLFGPLMQTFITGLMMFVYWTIGKAKQQVDVVHPQKSIEQNRIFRYRWSAFTVFMGFAMVLLFGFTQLSMLGLVRNIWVITGVPMIVVLGIVVSAIILSVTTGQGGSRVSVKQDESNGGVNRDDDRYWRFGMFYYNPDDPALFVEKRFGVGWTNNFARPMSWVMLAGLVAVIILISYVSKFLAG